MKLNALAPATGSHKPGKRVGRGPGSGTGKTAGRGVKGYKSRSGSSIRPGFEGGQMPLYRRLPKFGFRSKVALVTEQVRLGELAKVEGDLVTLETLTAAGLVRRSARRARVMLSGSIDRAVTVRGVALTRGARAAIEAAGGSVEVVAPKVSRAAKPSKKQATA